MNALKKEPERDMFQVAWLWYLVKDYGVSPVWQLAGQEEFYKSETSHKI